MNKNTGLYQSNAMLNCTSRKPALGDSLVEKQSSPDFEKPTGQLERHKESGTIWQ